jgi:excisionase family DNA binding protein
MNEVAARLGVRRRKIRQWVNAGRIPFIPLGRKLVKFREDAVDRFLANGEIPCRAAIQAPGYDSAKTEVSTTSAGQRAVAAASAARLRETAAKLKKSSANSSSHGRESQGLVIPIKPL